jgi:hypothetical protein
MGENRWTDAFILIAVALLALWVNSHAIEKKKGMVEGF